MTKLLAFQTPQEVGLFQLLQALELLHLEKEGLMFQYHLCPRTTEMLYSPSLQPVEG